MDAAVERRDADGIEQTSVLIVGAGPAGLVTAISLARHGVPSMLVERHPGTSIFPRATGISTRTMEILRSWGLEEVVRAGGFDAAPLARVAPTLVAAEGVTFPLGYPTADEALAVSPTTPALAPQDHLEPVLVEHLRSLGGDVRFATELAAFDMDPDGVTSTLVDRRSGRRTTVRSRFLVGADGAHSAVRSGLGIAMRGSDHLEEHLTALFEAPLSRLLSGPRYPLTMIAGPGGPAVFLPTDAGDRWVFARVWDPSAERIEDYTDARMADLIRAAAGVPDLEVRITRVMAFSFAAQLADRFRMGNAFLIGDAAHRITPRGGTGMNTAIHDAFNLGWKLAFVARGWAGDELLDTYETERRPVDERNTTRSAMTDGSERTTPDGLDGDLGVTYEDGAFLPAGPVPAPSATPADGDRWRQTARPGGRAPHLWLVDRDGARVSSLDLFEGGLTLLTGPAGLPWRRGATAAGPVSDVPLRVHVVGEAGDLRVPDGTFASLYGIEDGGAVLVRPDGHIAWRQAAAAHRDPRAELRRAIDAALGSVRAEARRVA